MNSINQAEATISSTSKSKIGHVIRVTAGNFVEMYDFFLFGLYATYISKTFYPTESEYAGLMLTFATFAAGFLMRPLGAIILGSYIDHIGRRKGLVVTLGIMAAGTITVAVTPGYDQIGLFAPLIILVGRLLQGFSAGVELGGVSVYLSEIAPPHRRGWFVSWQSASLQLSIMASAAIGYFLSEAYGKEFIAMGGWRIPFFVGCLIIPVAFYIRRSLLETQEFAKQSSHPTMTQVMRILAQNWQIILASMLLVVMSNVMFYALAVYTPTFAKSVLNLTSSQAFLITLMEATLNFIWVPIMGAVSDRVGRLPILLASAILAVVASYPMMSYLVANPDFTTMIWVELGLAFIYASYNGALIVTIVELVPSRVRTAGFSLAYSLSQAIFGGMTPLFITLLIQETGNKAAAGLWMMGSGVIALVAIGLIYGLKVKARTE